MSKVSHYQLSETMIEQFYREGYFYAPGFLTKQIVDAVNRENDTFTKVQNSGEWKSQGFVQIEENREQFPSTISFLTAPEVIEVFERILGDEVKLWLGMYAVVPPHGKGLDWHQDNQYTHILGHMLNGFIALDSITQDNAGLWLAPRSHLLGRQPNLNEDGEHKRAAEPANGRPCEPMAPGDAVFFHRETLHHSKQNRTDQPRRAFAFQVSAASCRYANTGKLLEDRVTLSQYK